MDPALLLLWRLKLKGFFRRWGKNLRKPKGILLTLVGMLMFVPWMMSIAFTPKAAMPWEPERVRQFGPLVLLGFAIMTLIFSGGERVLFFAPPEIDFLFAGPFTRRGLLAYKIVGVVFGVLFSSVFILLGFIRSSRSLPSAYLAIVLSFLFFNLLGMAVGLASNTVAAFATSIRRRAVLVGVAALLVLTAWSAGAEVLKLSPPEAWARIESSTALRVATAPFRPFVYAYTADRLWPDALAWSLVSVGMVGALLAFVFVLDAQYYEVAAASSARIYTQLQRMRQGGGMMPGRGIGMKTKRVKSRLAMLPWWGGIGPVLWRQLATAAREKLRLTIIALVMLAPAIVMTLTPPSPNMPKAQIIVYALAGMTLYGAGFFSQFVAFDFRGDVDRMEELKSLPIRAVPLAIGQLLTPVLVFILPAWVGFVTVSTMSAARPAEFVFMMILAPLAALLVGVDNLLFLLFPTRSNQVSTADFASMGRQVLLILAKFLLGGATIGLAALLGWVVEMLTGGGLFVAYLVALVAVTFAAASLVPFLALAFERYDVASDTPA